MNKSLGSICLGAIMAMAFSYHAAAADLPEIEKSGTLKSRPKMITRLLTL